MDKSNEKGETRNRYAKIQPLFNRTNGLQTGNPEEMKRQVDRESRSSVIPAATIFTPPTNAVETVKKQKKPKCRNKERLYHAPLLDLKGELLDILYCILYIMWYPILFSARLILTVVTRPAYMLLYNIFKSKNKPEENQEPDLNEYLTKPINDFNNPASLQEERKSDKIFIVQREDRKSRKKSESLRGKLNPPLRMVDKKRAGTLESESGEYFHYSSCHQNVSNVGLSSDCFSDKHPSRFTDSKDCRKKTTRQFQESLSVAGKKTSSCAPRNSSFKGSRTVVNVKRKIEASDPSRKSKLRLLMQNLNAQANKFPDLKLQTDDQLNLSHATDKQIADLKNQLINCYSSCKKSPATAMSIDFRRTSTDKSGPRAFPRLPLNPNSQKKPVSEDGEKYENRVEKQDCTLDNDVQGSTTASELHNTDVPPIAQLNHQATKELESGLCTARYLSQRTELDTAPIASNQHNSQRPLSERDHESLVSQGKADLLLPETESLDSRYLKEVPGLDGAEWKDEPTKQTEIKESSRPEKAEKDVQQSEKVHEKLEEDKVKIGSGDRPNTCKNGVPKTPKFTNPIDAKSKWLEMKKKFYAKDYAVAVNEQPEKLEATSLSVTAFSSELPAHKIFQYNMLVGRARQMRAEPPPPKDIFFEGKTTSCCLTALENGPRWSNSTRRELQASRSVVQTPRCLSQTRSLSQWPLNADSPFRTRKHCSMEENPRPKPRTKGGAFSPRRILVDGRTPAMGCLGFSQRNTSAHANSSVSTADVRTAGQNYSGDPKNRRDLKSRFEQRTTENPVHLSDEEAEDRGVYETAIINQDEKVSENFLGIDLRFLNDGDDQNRFAPPLIHEAEQSTAKPLDWPSAVKNTADIHSMKQNTNLSDQYAEKIDSLISFCEYPSSAPS